jgi:hypothetical protein
MFFKKKLKFFHSEYQDLNHQNVVYNKFFFALFVEILKKCYIFAPIIESSFF